MVQGRKLGPKREDVVGEWKNMHNEDPNNYVHQILLER